jgi:hypothetical protein
MSFLSKLFGSPAVSTIKDGAAPAPSADFRCVQVNANDAGCCDAVRAIAGKRFLPDEIPDLPLAGCDAESCNCSYELFSDRRAVPRNRQVGTNDEGRSAG